MATRASDLTGISVIQAEGVKFFTLLASASADTVVMSLATLPYVARSAVAILSTSHRQTLQVYASRDSVGDAIRKGGNKLEDAADSVADGFRGGKEDVKGAARDAKHAGRDARGEVGGKVSAAGISLGQALVERTQHNLRKQRRRRRLQRQGGFVGLLLGETTNTKHASSNNRGDIEGCVCRTGASAGYRLLSGHQ